MGYDFPSSPTVGQVFGIYTWDGEKWAAVGTAGGGAVVIADAPPVSAVPNSLWWESDTGTLYLYYNDGNSSQWVAVATSNQVTLGAVRYDVAQNLTVNQQAQGRANIGALKKNYIVNGGMQISQENGAAALTASSTYPVDMFFVAHAASGTPTFQQVASPTPSGSPNRLRVTATAADTTVSATDYLQIYSKMEGVCVADLRFGNASAKTITLSFGVRAPAGIYCVAIFNQTNNRTYVSEYTIAAGEANTDVVRSITIPGDITGTWAIDNGAGLAVGWTLVNGSSYQQAAGAWGTVASAMGSSNQFNFMGTAGNVFELFDVGLYEGNAAPPFVVPDYARELQTCQRYCETVENGTGYTVLGTGASANVNEAVIFIPFKVRKRWVPTLGYSSLSHFVVLRTGWTVPLAPTILASLYPGIDNMTLKATTSGGQTANDNVCLAVNNGAVGRLLFNSRL